MNAHSNRSPTLSSGMNGRDHYNETYKLELEKEAEWLKRSAPDKADSVDRLLRRNGIRPGRILELGCGTGAVLSELKQREIAEHYFGVDYSEAAIQYLSEQDATIRCAVADIMTTADPFEDVDSFDVVVLSHVIEHLEHPCTFLKAVNHIQFDYLVAEVPLEDLLFGRLKSLMKDRRDNPAGHVQFYHRKSFKSLLNEANLDIVDEYLYPPILDESTLRFAYEGQKRSVRVQKALTERMLPLLLRPIWSRLYHGHFAVLCKKRG